MEYHKNITWEVREIYTDLTGKCFNAIKEMNIFKWMSIIEEIEESPLSGIRPLQKTTFKF